MISDRSREALSGVHPDLVRVVEKADELGARFTVVCGLRTKAEQELLVKTGKSKTMRSRHLTGHAVDLVDEHFTWSDHAMAEIAAVMKRAAAECKVPIEWGGDWRSFIDTPHFQLPAAKYPDDEVIPPAPAVETVASSQPSPKPLVKSRTMWNLTGGLSFMTWLGGYFETALHIVTEAGTKFSNLAPARDVLATVGGNGKHIAFALGIGCLVSAISLVIGDKTPSPTPETDQ